MEGGKEKEEKSSGVWLAVESLLMEVVTVAAVMMVALVVVVVAVVVAVLMRLGCSWCWP